MERDELKITIYRITGRQLFFKVRKELCEECDLTIATVKKVIRSLKEGNAELQVKPWMNNILPALIKRAWHPPIVMIDGDVFSQGYVPDAEALRIEVSKRLKQKEFNTQEQHKVGGEPEVGSKAPDFSLYNTKTDKVSLYDLLSKQTVVLIFYRGDGCLFCNMQLASLKKDYEKIKVLGAEIVAVSVDSIEREKALSERLDLPFILLSDPEHEVIERYNVLNQNLFTRIYSLVPSRRTSWRGIAKSSIFIIDKDGIIRYKYVGKRTDDRPHNEELLHTLKVMCNSNLF